METGARLARSSVRLIACCLVAGFDLAGSSACDDSYVPGVRSLLQDAGATLDAAPNQAARGESDSADSSVEDSDRVSSADGGGAFGADGAKCENDDQCASDHCSNGVCCVRGECCTDTDDCSAGTGIALTCDIPWNCQGSRGPSVCRAFRCTTREGTPDDSACDSRVLADDCGPFASVYCTGEADQRMPRCADTCDSDNDCDRDAHCDGTCIPDVAKGGACDENSDCASAQCNGGRCCVEGNCARDLAESPAAGLRQCLDSLASDVCSECGCRRCTEFMLGCYDSGNEARDTLCSTVLECAFREACFAFCEDGRACFRAGCWCGPDCSGPSGSCTRPIEAAAGGANSATTLEQRAKDANYALHHAEQYGECLYANCRSECGL